MSLHTVKSFDAALKRVQTALTEMGRLAERQFAGALKAVVERDGGLAGQVVAGDARIDQLNDEVDRGVVALLALRAPVADDLRLAVTALKIASDIERIGDYAANIAKRAIVLNEMPPVQAARSLKRIGKVVHLMLTRVMEAYRGNDAGLARAVWEGDQEVDELYAGLFRELLTYMLEDPRNIAPCSHLLFVAKNIERIGDLATNVGEMTHFLITGRNIEGPRPKIDSLAQE